MRRYPKLLKKFNTRRPKWVDRREFLGPELQNLFSLSYFSEHGSIVPTGWSGVSEDRLYPRLDSRAPPPPVADQDMGSPSAWGNGTAPSDNDSSQEEQRRDPTSEFVTRMTEESDEDEEFPPVKVCMLLAGGPDGDRSSRLLHLSVEECRLTASTAATIP